MKATALLIPMLLLTPPPLVWGSDIASPTNPGQANDLCNSLIRLSHEISTLLNTVVDFDSAEKAAPQLNAKTVAMKKLLSELEQLPFDAETTHIIAGRMVTLTHITQAQMPKIQELISNHAYGSAALVAHLQRYNAEQNLYKDAPSDSGLPYAQLYSGMSAALNKSVCKLRNVSDKDSADEAARLLRESIKKHQQLFRELTTLSSLESPPQHMTLRNALIPLRDEMQREQERLKAQNFFGSPDLPGLIGEYLQLIP